MIKCQVYFKEQTTSKEYVNLLTFLTVVTALIIFSNAAYYLDCEESFCLCVALEICSITSLSANFLICISTPSSSLRCHSSFTQCGRHKQNLPMSSARAKCPELRTAGLWGWFHAMGCEQWCPPLPCWAREAGVQGSLDVTPPAARDDRSYSHWTEAARHPTAQTAGLEHLPMLTKDFHSKKCTYVQLLWLRTCLLPCHGLHLPGNTLRGQPCTTTPTRIMFSTSFYSK